jgi:hypothetical protein
VPENQFTTFIPVYGIPHSSTKIENHTSEDTGANGESKKLQTMLQMKQHMKSLLSTAIDNSVFLYVFGDLQDTPDNSKIFHSGSCRIAKHPLGIVQNCEDFGLTCSIYAHVETKKHPIISHHGSKGGRFIDGMYTSNVSLADILGISIIEDAGIHSDHDLVVSKIDLGIEQFQINKEQEERFDFKSIMNTPVILKADADHIQL